MDTKQENNVKRVPPLKLSWMFTQLMNHHTVFTLTGWVLLVLGLLAASAGIVGLTTAGAFAVVGTAVGMSLCAAGGATALLGGLLVGCGGYGRYKAKGLGRLWIPQEQDENEQIPSDRMTMH